MKVAAYVVTYNDVEYLQESVNSLKPFVDNIFIIEGAWQSTIEACGVSTRSNKLTLDVINRLLDDKVKLIQVNCPTETSQRNFALDLCRKSGADYCWSFDADEVYKPSSVKLILEEMSKGLNDPNIFGFKCFSYNFINTFDRYYHGIYPRIYKITPGAYVYDTNHVTWPENPAAFYSYKELSSKDMWFYHYSYTRKNSHLFHHKMKFLEKEFGSNLYEKGYRHTPQGYEIPIPDNEIFNFDGYHPLIMENHPRFIGQNLLFN